VKAKKKTSKPKTKASTELFLEYYPINSSFAESYRTLRTSIHFSFMEKELRSLLITSAGQNEGKTTTVANLSYTMAQAGKSVLMIDADLRKPALSRMIPTQGSTGLSGLLSDTFGADVRSGSLAELGVSDLFWLLSFQKKTGVLHLTDGKEKISVYCLRGELVDVNWVTRPDEKKMATLLIKNKLLTREQAEQAFIRKKNTGQKLGFILINMGLVKKDDLTGFITLHIIEGLRTALQLEAQDQCKKPLPPAKRPSTS
jgi:hypothetical protein